ncbi:transmembrane protein, putative [Medicago truncatula]|nr:transmembrane protein, putative [Medicago truncatula]
MMNDDKRFKKIVVTTMSLSLVLIMIGAMNMSSYFGKFMAEHDTAVMLILIAVVFLFQIALGYGRTLHRVPNPNPNNNTVIIIYTLLLSSVISSIEASLVSRNAAIITFIFCHITFSIFVLLHEQEIPHVIRGLACGLTTASWASFLYFTFLYSLASLISYMDGTPLPRNMRWWL